MSDDALYPISFEDLNDIARNYQAAIDGQGRENALEELKKLRKRLKDLHEVPRKILLYKVGASIVSLISLLFILNEMHVIAIADEPRWHVLLYAALAIIVGWSFGKSIAPDPVRSENVGAEIKKADSLKKLIAENDERLPEEEAYIKNPLHLYVFNVSRVLDQYDQTTEGWRYYKMAREYGLPPPLSKQDVEKEVFLHKRYCNISNDMERHAERAEFLSEQLFNLPYIPHVVPSNGLEQLELLESSIDEFNKICHEFMKQILMDLPRASPDRRVETSSNLH